jgi:hypothetical protein
MKINKTPSEELFDYLDNCIIWGRYEIARECLEENKESMCEEKYKFYDQNLKIKEKERGNKKRLDLELEKAIK